MNNNNVNFKSTSDVYNGTKPSTILEECYSPNPKTYLITGSTNMKIIRLENGAWTLDNSGEERLRELLHKLKI